MTAHGGHAHAVAAWADGVDGGATELLDAFDGALRRLWDRAHQTLGDVTLVAIVDRVLYTASEAHPMLSSVSVGEAGLSLDGLRERIAGLDRRPLEDAARFVLEEYLRVLGDLTADILTPALHAALAAEPASDAEEAP